MKYLFKLILGGICEPKDSKTGEIVQLNVTWTRTSSEEETRAADEASPAAFVYTHPQVSRE